MSPDMKRAYDLWAEDWYESTLDGPDSDTESAFKAGVAYGKVTALSAGVTDADREEFKTHAFQYSGLSPAGRCARCGAVEGEPAGTTYCAGNYE